MFLSVETGNGLITEPVESQHQQKVLLRLQMGAGGLYDGRDLAACDWPEGSASTGPHFHMEAFCCRGDKAAADQRRAKVAPDPRPRDRVPGPPVPGLVGQALARR